MIYSEAAYFDNNHCQHCADRDEQTRLERARRVGGRVIERRRRARPKPH